MFTGIIETTAKILDTTSSGLTIERPRLFDDIKIGSSVCVSGVCLSVVTLSKISMQFDVVPETLKKTTLGKLTKGDRINLERAMELTDRFEGHVVQGHVEGVGDVERVQKKGESALVTVHFPPSLLRGVIPQGSVTVDGVSLTIASLDKAGVTVALIPHTLKTTTLGSLTEGDHVNIETDYMVRALQTLYPASSRS